MITREHTWQNIKFREDYSHMDGPQVFSLIIVVRTTLY